MNVIRRIWLLPGVLLLFCPDIVHAQEPPRLSIGAGAGVAFPFHGDFDFTPWAWDADLRLALARHALVEVAVGEWRHSETRVYENLPTSLVGTIGRLDFTTTHVQRTVQANMLFTAARRRLRVNAGGGVGVLQHRRLTTEVRSGCTGGAMCQSDERSVSNSSGTAQMVGGIDVAVTGGFALYGQARFVVPFTDPGGSDLRLTAGARLTFGR